MFPPAHTMEAAAFDFGVPSTHNPSTPPASLRTPSSRFSAVHGDGTDGHFTSYGVHLSGVDDVPSLNSKQHLMGPSYTHQQESLSNSAAFGAFDGGLPPSPSHGPINPYQQAVQHAGLSQQHNSYSHSDGHQQTSSAFGRHNSQRGGTGRGGLGGRGGGYTHGNRHNSTTPYNNYQQDQRYPAQQHQNVANQQNGGNDVAAKHGGGAGGYSNMSQEAQLIAAWASQLQQGPHGHLLAQTVAALAQNAQQANTHSEGIPQQQAPKDAWGPPAVSAEQNSAGNTIPYMHGEMKLFVGNLPPNTTSGDLMTLFARYEPLVEVFVFRRRHTATGASSAFVRFRSEELASTAVEEFSGTEWRGMQLVVRPAVGKKTIGDATEMPDLQPPIRAPAPHGRGGAPTSRGGRGGRGGIRARRAGGNRREDGGQNPHHYGGMDGSLHHPSHLQFDNLGYGTHHTQSPAQSSHSIQPHHQHHNDHQLNQHTLGYNTHTPQQSPTAHGGPQHGGAHGANPYMSHQGHPQSGAQTAFPDIVSSKDLIAASRVVGQHVGENGVNVPQNHNSSIAHMYLARTERQLPPLYTGSTHNNNHGGAPAALGSLEHSGGYSAEEYRAWAQAMAVAAEPHSAGAHSSEPNTPLSQKQTHNPYSLSCPMVSHGTPTSLSGGSLSSLADTDSPVPNPNNRHSLHHQPRRPSGYHTQQHVVVGGPHAHARTAFSA